MTTISIPGHWLRGSGVDINAWLASKGATVFNRRREGIRWRITIEETLTQSQKANLKTLMEAKFNTVTFE